ncbi:MAG: choice-of-anchor D domain-containing protein, partial [Deltaproteobacteria bacterium]|nr:choice-of-anchor D domain-containing protein [Deltaproteobacteria bacterium]
MTIKHLAPLLALAAACTAPPAPDVDTSLATSALSSIVVNGSFETGDYTGWTLAESSGVPSLGTWGIAGDGETIGSGATVFDFADGVPVQQFTPGLPHTYHATDGVFVALQLQNGGEQHRMFQTVQLPACQPLLLWDMEYRNHNGAFDAGAQYLAVNVRDPDSDAVLATPFKTMPGAPPVVPAMTPFEADLTPFAGQTVRLDFEQQVQLFHLDAAYDHVRVICKGLGALPGALDFGSVVTGAAATRQLAVANFASDPLTISSLSATGPFLVTGAPALPRTLQPGESVQLEIAFAPSSAGPATGALTIASDDPNGASVVALSGVGEAQAGPRLVADPSSIAFGDVPVGQTSTVDVVLSNPGDQALVISSTSSGGPYSVVLPSFPLEIGPGGSAVAQIVFAPPLPGAAAGAVAFGTNDPAGPLFLPLSGNGVTAQLTLTPGAVDFGAQRVGTAGAPALVRVANIGLAPVTLGAPTAGQAFAVTGPASILLGPGAFVDYAVAFAPTAEGPVFDLLVVPTDNPFQPNVAAALSGVGLAPRASPSVGALVFGAVRTGTTATRTFSIANLGSAPLAIAAPPASPPFSVAPAAAVIVAPGDSAAYVATFAPAAAGPAEGVIAFATDGGNVFVGASGTGVQPVLAVSPPALDLGDVRVGQVSGAAAFAVENAGGDMLTVTAITVAPPFALDAAVGLPFTLPPGGTRSFGVTFAPAVHAAAAGAVA